MGNCLISVHVIGAHHNGRPDDIDQLAAKFTDELKAKGHNVMASTIVTGGESDLVDPARRLPLKVDPAAK